MGVQINIMIICRILLDHNGSEINRAATAAQTGQSDLRLEVSENAYLLRGFKFAKG